LWTPPALLAPRAPALWAPPALLAPPAPALWAPLAPAESGVALSSPALPVRLALRAPPLAPPAQMPTPLPQAPMVQHPNPRLPAIRSDLRAVHTKSEKCKKLHSQVHHQSSVELSRRTPLI
jgi:hypothetical protein